VTTRDIMKKITLVAALCAVTIASFSQSLNKIINTASVERIEKILSADDMQGRRSGTPGIDKAADFISNEFKTIGLKTFNGLNGYKQTFQMISAKSVSISATFDNQLIDPKTIIAFTGVPELKITQDSGYKKVYIKAGESAAQQVTKLLSSNENLLVVLDTSFARLFNRLGGLKRYRFKLNTNVVFVLTTADPKQYEVTAVHEITETPMTNVIGILPGKRKKNEHVILSGHYDHLGIGKPVEGDSIYNGANDDAAGTTAVIMLAKYFKALRNNKRTIVFAAFTAEEMGGFGSQYFSDQLDAERVTAMFNIEMIGTESKWGKGSAYITGYEKTDMGKILEQNLKGTDFKFYPDPYPHQNLFYRSDNATLARLGVPAHTISTSKMDNEPFYHTVNDEFETLDIKNMTEIIKAIALSSKSIIKGKDTPTRVNTAELR